MTDIPYNYRKYIDDVTKMRQRGHIDASQQIASPSSAGSRGLAKTDNFTKPCKECWWCREKKWAFGMYDGGVV